MPREFLGGAQIYNLSPVCHYLLLHLRDHLLLSPALQLGLLLLSSDSLHLLLGLHTSLAFLLELFGTRRFLLGPLLFLGFDGGRPRGVASELRDLLSQLLNVRLVVVLDLGEQGGDDGVLPAEDL
jgi:hypothetical protein